MPAPLKTAAKIVAILALLYVFFISIQLMGDSFKTWKAFSHALIEQASSPLVGLFIGIVATSVIQSSSTTTSMVVGFVASGVLSVELAVPIIMGANIGTSVTNTLVSLGHIQRKQELRRAMACGSVHDMFNVFAVVTLLPLELITRHFWGTGILQRMASALALVFEGAGGFTFTSPLKTITKPVSKMIRHDLLGSAFSGDTAIAIAGLFLSMAGLMLTLVFIVKTMRSLVLDRVETFFTRYVGAHALIGIGLGIVMTVAVQSSSITTSMLVPMAGAGILTLEHAFPITLGANVGTTITAILASLAAAGDGDAQRAAVTIAFVHLLFNVSGIVLLYPVPAIRRIPIHLARMIADACAERRWLAPVYVVVLFFVIPGALITLHKLLS